jgi:hypothetical protein
VEDIVNRTCRTVFAAVATLLIGASAFAQQQPTSYPPALPKWEFGGGAGLLYLRSEELFSPCVCGGDDWDPTTELRADLGRYWTEHIDTSISVGVSPTVDHYETRILRSDGVDRYVGNQWTSRVTTVSPRLTYQFLSNAFMHPYVSGGVRLGVVEEHRFRDDLPYQLGTVRYVVPRLDERRTIVVAKPFVAAGAKSYLTDSAFVRSEILAASRTDGIVEVSLHLGIGLDF